MKAHLKRLTVPKSWDIRKKKNVFIIRPHPGGQRKDLTMPLLVLLRDVLKVAKTAKEVKYVLNNKDVLVNGKKRKEIKFPVSFMDVIEIPQTKKSYRMLISSKAKLVPLEVTGADAGLKVHKLASKKSVSKKTQLNFSDGSNMLVDKDEYKTGDSVLVDFKKKKLLDHLKLDKKAVVYIIGGKNVGEIGTVQDIKGKDIIIKTKAGEFETSRDYAFVVGKEKPVVKCENG
jgi:small subunit ribosomal protein S4e